MLLQFVVRRGDERQPLGVVAETLAAAAGPLHPGQQRLHQVEMLTGLVLVPRPQRQQREQVHQVVVEQDGEHAAVGTVLPAQADQVVEHVDRDRVVVDPVGHAVPVVERVQAFLGAGAAVVVGDGHAEIALARADVPDVRAHALSQAEQGMLEVAAIGREGQDVGPHVEQTVDEMAHIDERHGRRAEHGTRGRGEAWGDARLPALSRLCGTP